MTKADYRSTTALVRKTTMANVDDGLVFVMNEENEDDLGDLIRVNGWRFDRFNGVGLFNHQKDFICGRWEKPYVEGKKLKARLILAPAGSSPRIDEIRALVSCGALRACSVGFAPIRSRPRAGGGIEYLEQSLLECSLVAVGCHPSALMEAKRLGVTTSTIRKIFRMSNNDDNLTLGERIARAKAARKKAEAVLKRSKTKSDPPPKLLTARPEMREKATSMSRNKQIHEKAKAYIRKIQREEHELKRDPKPQKPGTWDGHEYTTIYWRGQPIRVRKWHGQDV
jgi:hypothetical protein